MSRHKKHEEHEEHASEAWLVAFADMMTLLMVTFLMMFAISSLDLQKFKTFQQALNEGLGKNTHQLAAEGAPPEGTPKDVTLGSKDGTPVATPSPVPLTTGEKLQPEDLAELKKKVDAAVAAAGLTGAVQTQIDPRGLILYVTNGVLFDAGKARLTDQGNGLLDRIGPVLAPFSNNMIIEGHTDSRPISTREYPSNWELSTARATAVLRHLIDADRLAPARLSAAGYADTHPRDPGTGPTALALNRRVDIVVLAPAPAPTTTVTETAAAPTPAPSTEASTEAASKH